MDRIVLHIDMDAFFAQVEERENPQFSNKPIVVGSDPKGGQGRGVVSTANYEARKYGIHSALPISWAWRACPSAIFLPVNMPLYFRVSEAIMEIVRKYSDKQEITSLDEAYLDISGCASYEKATELAAKLKQEILQTEKLVCTVGVGPNKMIAKMATNFAKPNGLKVVAPEEAESFLADQKVEQIPGIGPKASLKLKALGAATIAELKNISPEVLLNEFGKVGEDIYLKARGIEDSQVTSDWVAKSIGKNHTFEKDTRDPEAVFMAFNKIIDEVYQQLVEERFLFKTITVTCRFSGFETHTKAKTLKELTNDKKIFRSEVKILLLKFLLENPKPLRLIGARVSSLIELEKKCKIT